MSCSIYLFGCAHTLKLTKAAVSGPQRHGISTGGAEAPDGNMEYDMAVLL